MNCSLWHVLKKNRKQTFLLFLVSGISWILYWSQKTGLFNAELHDPKTTGFLKNSGADDGSSEINLVVQAITSLLDYPPRKLPTTEDIIQGDPQVFSELHHQFLPNIKSPCWYEEFQNGSDLYENNMFYIVAPYLRKFFQKLEIDFQKNLKNMDGKQHRLRCLPYFYIIGQRKCGTTDLFKRLKLHPQIKFSLMKEPHWWTDRGFRKSGFYHEGVSYDRIPVKDFLDLFDPAARLIQTEISKNVSDDSIRSNITIGEASSSTINFNQVWTFYEAEGETEPLIITADIIHMVQPDAKIIAILRDPVERIYSDYLYFDVTNNKTAEDFHLDVISSLHEFRSCLSERSLRDCAYIQALYTTYPVTLQLGMYIVFLMDWVDVFKQENILVLRLEDYTENLVISMRQIWEFLEVDPLTPEMEEVMLNLGKSNTRKEEDVSVGSMLPATRDLLKQFYQPFNRKLASFLKNDLFLWS